MYDDIDVIQQWNRDRCHQMIRSFEHSRADEVFLRIAIAQCMNWLRNYFVGWGKHLQTAAKYGQHVGTKARKQINVNANESQTA